MKYVGETLQGFSKACIGIGAWGTIANTEKLRVVGEHVLYEVEYSLGSNVAFLDPNHTHHLLVDDGSFQSFGAELKLRSKLELYINKSGASSVLIALNGGPAMLSIVHDAVLNKQSVFIIVNSGRCADLIAFAYNNISDEILEKISAKTYFAVNILEQICEFLPELDTEEKQLNGYKILMDCLENKRYITLLEMSEKNSLDEAILSSILTEEKSLFKQLLITLWWNQPEKAMDCISKVAKLASENEEKALKNAMVVALAVNRVDFVKLFLSYGINIQTLLTLNVLEFLYGYRYKVTQLKNKPNLLNYFHIIKDLKPALDNKTSEDLKIVINLLCSYENLDPYHVSISLKNVKEAIQKACYLFSNHEIDLFIKEKDYTAGHFSYPFKELFFFALVNNMHKMATYFWSFEEQSLAKAFFGREICKYFVRKAKEYDLPDNVVQRSKQKAEDFSKLCVDLLNQCYGTDRMLTEKLLTCSIIQNRNTTCLSLAVLAYHKDFVSHHAVQNLLNDVWTGYIKTNLTWFQYLFAILFPPCISLLEFQENFTYTEIDSSENQCSLINCCSFLCKKKQRSVYATCINLEEQKKMHSARDEALHLSSSKFIFKNKKKEIKNTKEKPINQKMSFINKVWNFYFHTPVVKFITNLFSYLIFLLLFAYVAMSDTKPLIEEWILAVYILSFTIEEINEINQEESLFVKGKFCNWWSSYWNRLDVLAILIFFIGFGLRFDERTSDVAHNIYAINAGMWVLRLLNVFYVNRMLGLYVVMISKMFLDMVYFLVILFVFLLAFGISTASILTPQDSEKHMFVQSIFRPYFNIYGELFIDRDAQTNKTRFGTDMTNNYAEPIVWILLGAYLLIANVLLLNLLIAIFNNTYQDVQSRAKQIWMFERYGLIREYANRPPLPPPFIILCHIYMVSNFLINLCFGKKQTRKKVLKSFLTEHQRQEINDFEKGCKSQLLTKNKNIRICCNITQ
ncbi:transient receptor potential cation channel subfamily M member 3 isoform X2 [Hydra vulgaris]|nr:transient receptor potential cation channel subfamily M member 3 isoform X2 [Hydra vulgaris]